MHEQGGFVNLLDGAFTGRFGEDHRSYRIGVHYSNGARLRPELRPGNGTAELPAAEIEVVSAVERMGQVSDCESWLHARLRLNLAEPAGEAPPLLRVLYGPPGALTLRGIERPEGRSELAFAVPVVTGERRCLAVAWADLAGRMGPESRPWCLVGASPAPAELEEITLEPEPYGQGEEPTPVDQEGMAAGPEGDDGAARRDEGACGCAVALPAPGSPAAAALVLAGLLLGARIGRRSFSAR